MQWVNSNKVQVAILDLSEVLMAGLLGTEVLVSEDADVSIAEAYTALHLPILTELMYGQIPEQRYLSACATALHHKVSAGRIGELIRRNMTVYKYSGDLVDLFKKKELRTCLLSNHAKEWIAYCKTLMDFDAMFDEQVYSFDVATCKPDPRIFNVAMEKLHATAGECLFVDDSNSNVAAAKELGMQALCFNDYEGFTAMWR